MADFITDCINADARLEDIDIYVKRWHESESELSIYEYLGMTRDEYGLWVEDDAYLKDIILAHAAQNCRSLPSKELESSKWGCDTTMPTTTYKVKRVNIDNMGNVYEIGKRCLYYTDNQPLRVGGLYFLGPRTGFGVSKSGLFRVEAIVKAAK